MVSNSRAGHWNLQKEQLFLGVNSLGNVFTKNKTKEKKKVGGAGEWGMGTEL